MEAAQGFKDRQELSRGVPDGDVRVMVTANQLFSCLRLGSKEVRVSEPGHSHALVVVSLILLNNQTVVVLVKLQNLLSFKFFGRHWVLEWLKERCAWRHDSLKLDLITSELIT